MGFLDKAKDLASSAGSAVQEASANAAKNRRAKFEERRETVNEFLREDEEVIEVLEPRTACRDFAVFTDKRMIWVDIQGISGNKIGYISLPYSKVSTFAVRTSGLLDLDCELSIAFSGNIATFEKEVKDKDKDAVPGQFLLNCPAKSDIKKLCKIISGYIL